MTEQKAVKKPRPAFTSAEKFLFETPLYAAYDVKLNWNAADKLLSRRGLVVDGHCPFCNQSSTFRQSNDPPYPAMIGGPPNSFDFRIIRTEIMCARSEHHRLIFYIVVMQTFVMKIGQYPSLADIANDEAREYRSVMSPTDAAEFHRAIGLAAHGVGIGSFVYLRRIFERLIWNTFNNHEVEQGWDPNAFREMRMSERIGFLRDYLPSFLVEHKEIYGFLSKGLHELTEEECRAEFDVLKMAIIVILEDHKEQRTKKLLRDELSKKVKELGSLKTTK